MVPQEVQYQCLHRYVEKCSELHALAFLQWRRMFPNPDTYNEEEIDELIEARYRKILKGYDDQEAKQLSEETAQAG